MNKCQITKYGLWFECGLCHFLFIYYAVKLIIQVNALASMQPISHFQLTNNFITQFNLEIVNRYRNTWILRTSKRFTFPIRKSEFSITCTHKHAYTHREITSLSKVSKLNFISNAECLPYQHNLCEISFAPLFVCITKTAKDDYERLFVRRSVVSIQ